MLDLAKQRLRDILAALWREIDEGIPIVVLEPSCAAVFHDELRNLLPDDARAKRLSTLVSSLSEFLTRHIEQWSPRSEQRLRVVVHGHCHQRALSGMTADQQVLDRLGVEYQVIDSGCCGMAGSFGFERHHVDVSQAIGEQRLMPALRSSSADTLVIADGFSCREQIEQATGRRAIHLAEVIAMQQHDGVSEHSSAGRVLPRAAALLAAAAGVAAVLYMLQRAKPTIRNLLAADRRHR
jgi:Fe-S oxidoreductase